MSAPVQQVPAAWVPQHRQTQVEGAVPLSPETQSALQGAYGASQQVDELTRQAEVERQKSDAAANAANVAQAQTDLQEAQAQKAAQADMQAKQWNHVLDAQRTMEEAQAKGVDQHRWLANKSTGSKMAMAIGLIASGFNQGTHGGENVMLNQINKEIDRDVDSQKEAIAGKEHSFSNAISMYGVLRQKGLDDSQASDGARLLARKLLDAQLKAANPQTAMGQLQVQKAIADNDAHTAQLRAQFDEKSSGKTTTSSAEAFRPAQTVGGPQAFLDEVNKVYMLKRGEPGNTWDSAVRDVLRHHGQDPTPGAPEPIIGVPKGGAGSARALAKPAMAAQAHIADLQALAKLADTTVAGPQTQGQYDALAAKLRSEGVPVPESSSIFSRLSGATQGALQTLIASEKAKLGAAQNVAANGVGGQPVGCIEGDEGKDPDTFEE